MLSHDRLFALQVARSLQNQQFLYAAEGGNQILQDRVEDLYLFLEDQAGTNDVRTERELLLIGAITMLTYCYSPTYNTSASCYSYSCPRNCAAFWFGYTVSDLNECF